MRRKRKNRWKKSVFATLLFLLVCGGCKAASETTATETTVQETDVSATSEMNAQETGTSAVASNTEGTLTVTFLDVGQGNSILVEQDGAYMLIDGGDREYSSFVVSYLKEQGVEELEYVIASHYDADHLNGIVGALHVFPCKLVLGPDDTADSRVYDSFLNVLEEKDIELVYPAVGDTYTLGDAEFTVVCPNAYDASDGNDNSIGIRLVFGENAFLICGDAGIAVEKEMLQSGIVLESDVYLASHHGSDGSSSLEFMQAVSPEVVVISAGGGNSYGHPTRTVLDNVQTVGAVLYRTDLQGTLVANSDGSSVSWNVQPCMDYRSGGELAGAEISGEVTTPETAGAGTFGTDTDMGSAGVDMPADTDYEQAEYVINRNTKKFHLPSCSSAGDISAENKAYFTGSREELIAAGYEPCKRCNP